MRIEKPSVKNIQAIKAITVTPDRTFQVVSGANGNGKSSLLHAIQYAFAGKRSHPPMPVREGEDRGAVVVEVGNRTVKLVLKDGKSSLTVTDRETGTVMHKPQDRLNAFLGDLTFDPLRFAQMKPPEQREVLVGLVGLPIKLHDHDTYRRELFEERAAVNRKAKDLAGVLRRNHPPGESFEGVPAEPIDVSELTSRMVKTSERIRANDTFRARLTQTREKANSSLMEVGRLLQELDKARAIDKERWKDVAGQKELVATLHDPDIAGLQAGIDQAGATNERIRQRAARDLAEKDVAEQEAISERLTDQIAGMDEAKTRAFKDAEWPVEGLGVEDACVTFNGRPLEQSSASEKLACSVAIGMALNPDLKVMFIEDGSLLDEQSMAKLRQVAEDNEFQVWIERVSGHAEPGSIHIVDGSMVDA